LRYDLGTRLAKRISATEEEIAHVRMNGKGTGLERLGLGL
jgi:hypothetical protein